MYIVFTSVDFYRADGIFKRTIFSWLWNFAISCNHVCVGMNFFVSVLCCWMCADEHYKCGSVETERKNYFQKTLLLFWSFCCGDHFSMLSLVVIAVLMRFLFFKALLEAMIMLLSFALRKCFCLFWYCAGNETQSWVGIVQIFCCFRRQTYYDCDFWMQFLYVLFLICFFFNPRISLQFQL